jgi:hypothetical protein
MTFKVLDLAGQRFGRLVVQERARRGEMLFWRCVCVAATRSWLTQSCWCFRKKGPCNDVKPTEKAGRGRARYRAWIGMKSRCFNRTSPAIRNMALVASLFMPMEG